MHVLYRKKHAFACSKLTCYIVHTAACQAPFVGDSSACTLDSDGDGYPDVPLSTCDEDSTEIYCIKVTRV